MTDPTPRAPALDDDDLNERRWFTSGVQGIEIGVLVLLLIVMLGQSIYLLSYSKRMRESQDALICQWQVTNQLRTAANFERQAQRDMLTIVVNTDLPETQRKVQAEAALKSWLLALDKSDADRAAVPLCPDPRPTPN